MIILPVTNTHFSNNVFYKIKNGIFALILNRIEYIKLKILIYFTHKYLFQI